MIPHKCSVEDCNNDAVIMVDSGFVKTGKGQLENSDSLWNEIYLCSEHINGTYIDGYLYLIEKD